MNDFFYNPQNKELVVYDNFQVYQLNDTAAFVLEQYTIGASQEEIITKLLNEYDVDIEEAQNDVDETLATLRSIGISLENYINPLSNSYLDNFSLISENFHPHTPIVHIIQNCNSPCSMCDCWKTKEKSWHPAEKLRKFFIEIKKRKATAVMLSGGEPLLHPELPTIIADLQELGIKIMLNTNGLLLHRHPWIAECKIEQLVISMDGVDAETYRYFRGVNGYNVVWNNLERFQQSSPHTQIGIRTILNKYNYNKIDQLYDAIESRGMHSVGLSPADVGSTSFSRKEMSGDRKQDLKTILLPSVQEIETFLQTFHPENNYYKKIEQAYSKGLSAWQPRDFIQCMLFYLGLHKGETEQFVNRPCFFPFLSMVLDYDGSLRNCFYSQPFGNLYQLESVDWKFTQAITELRASNRCQNCRGKIFCDAETSSLARLS